MAREENEPRSDLGTNRKRRTRGRSATLIPALVLIGLIAYGFLAPARDSSSPRRAPDFELELLSGSGTLSSKDLEGDVVVFNFWASWCAPCRAEMPLLEEMWQKYRDDGVQIVGVLVQDSKEGGRELVDELGITYPTVYGQNSELRRLLKGAGLPQTFFVDRNYEFIAASRGRLLEGTGDRVTLGQISATELERKITELLDEDR